MRIWLGYRFRGEDKEVLKRRLKLIIAELEAAGHEVLTMAGSIQKWQFGAQPMTDLVGRGIDMMDNCDLGLFVHETADPSEGRGWEAGFFAGKGKPTVIARRRDCEVPFNDALYLMNRAWRDVLKTPVIVFRSYRGLVRDFNGSLIKR